MKGFLQKWLGYDHLVKSLEDANNQLHDINKELRSELDAVKIYIHDEVNKFVDSTRIDCELGMRGKNTIVLTGVYKNRGYVEFYDLDQSEFHEFVERLKYMRKDNLIRHVDGPLGFDFKGFFDIRGKNDRNK